MEEKISELINRFPSKILSWESGGYPISIDGQILELEHDIVKLSPGPHKPTMPPDIDQAITILLYDQQSAGDPASNHISFHGYLAKIYQNVWEVRVTSIVGEDKLDEPFSDILLSSIPKGSKYLKNFNAELAENIFRQQETAILTTTFRGSLHSEKIAVHYQDKYLCFSVPENSTLHKQMQYNPYINLAFDNSEISMVTTHCFVKGYASRIQKQENSNDSNGAWMEIMCLPLSMSYGTQMEIQTIELNNKPSLLKEIPRVLKRGAEYWYHLLRVPYLISIVIPVLLGASFAGFSGSFEVELLLLTILGLLLAQIGLNLSNDFFDMQNDSYKYQESLFSSGSRYIYHGLATPLYIITVGAIMLLIAGTIGLYLNSVSPGNTVLIIAIIAAALAFFYSASPLKLAYRGMGEAAIVLIYGPLPAIASYLIFSKSFAKTDQILLYAIPVGIMAMLVVLVNNIHDIIADDRANKRTLAVRLGRKKAILLFVVLMVLCNVFVSIIVLTNYTGLLIMLLPSLLLVYRVIQDITTSEVDFDKIALQTIIIQALLGLVLVISNVVG